MNTYTTRRNNQKYNILLQRGYTESQIDTLLQERQQQLNNPRQNHHLRFQYQSKSPQHRTHSVLHNQNIPHNKQNQNINHQTYGPSRPQQESIEQSVMFSYQNQSNQRRAHHVVRSYPENVPPRAHIQMQFKPDKSSVEGILQNTYQQRENDAFVPKGNIVHSQCTRSQYNTQMSTISQSSNVKTTPSRKKKTRRQQFEQGINSLKDLKEDAFTLLNVRKDYTLKELAKKYRKSALTYHPDRLIKHSEYITNAQKKHCEEMFEKITKAYFFLIEEFNKRKSDKPFYELRKHSKEECTQQDANATNPTTTKNKLGEGDSFNVKLFNTLYDENRLYDVNDEGYEHWMKSDDGNDTSKLFSNKFNANVFNTTFEQLKKDDPHGEKQLIAHQEMGVVVHSDSTPYSTLGEGNIKDFTGNTSSLQYSDLKDAHTTHATLIDTSRVKQQPTFNSIKEMEAHRSQIQHTLSPEEAELQDYLKQKKTVEEEQRLERLEARDKLVSKQHTRIQQRLLQ